MERIIAGRFETMAGAEGAAGVLAAYLDPADIVVFFNNPPGQHDALGGGGDEDEDPGTEGASQSAAGAAVAGGIAGGAIGAVGGPVVALAAAAIGAYSGSLVGAMAGLGTDEPPARAPLRRPSGVMVSVRIALAPHEQRVIATLRAEGARDVEVASGEWRDGDWTDFDPTAVPHLVAMAGG